MLEKMRGGIEESVESSGAETVEEVGGSEAGDGRGGKSPARWHDRRFQGMFAATGAYS
jgi:hypothetical protein